MAPTEKDAPEAAVDAALSASQLRELREQLQRSELQRKDLVARFHEVEERAIRAENLRESLFGLTQEPLDVPRWTRREGTAKKTEHIPLLLLGDLHWGEVISPEKLGSTNRYDVATAQERYQRVISQAVDISTNHLPQHTYPGLIVIRLGDMVSGEIHADLRESNELELLSGIRSLVEAEAWGLRALADQFRRVWVISVSGNHGRLTQLPQSKRLDNVDTFSAWWLESLFRQDDRVGFFTPRGTDALFTVHGRRYVATHGDKIGSRGGRGYLGPVATAQRGLKQVHDTYAAQGCPLTAVFIGHFHTSLRTEYGWCNGSLSGYAEFGRDGRMRPAAPIQLLLMLHAKYGVTSEWGIRAAPEPTIDPSAELRPFEVVG